MKHSLLTCLFLLAALGARAQFFTGLHLSAGNVNNSEIFRSKFEKSFLTVPTISTMKGVDLGWRFNPTAEIQLGILHQSESIQPDESNSFLLETNISRLVLPLTIKLTSPHATSGRLKTFFRTGVYTGIVLYSTETPPIEFDPRIVECFCGIRTSFPSAADIKNDFGITNSLGIDWFAWPTTALSFEINNQIGLSDRYINPEGIKNLSFFGSISLHRYLQR